VARAEAFRVQIGDYGRLVLPAKVRKQLSLRRGDELLIAVQPDGSLRLTKSDQVAKQPRGLYPLPARQRSSADERIAERRAEVTKEMVRRRRESPSL
jgi:AbrB family looped-hinge helix DNA binding protein